ncbi:hypothetical protein RRSWK_03930 [Rhodopirellula sp. SWK7]|nr:hypothetical protein RRSWK_03930 [Rhodopirellula sp. SWK7]
MPNCNKASGGENSSYTHLRHAAREAFMLPWPQCITRAILLPPGVPA